MQNNPIRKSYCCQLQTLTPVHIGSGETLASNFDFFIDGNQLRVVNTTRLFNKIEALGADAIERFSQAVEDNTVLDWLRRHQINLSEITQHAAAFNESRTPRDIRAHIRDGFGKLLIPGSSLKGALRTAVLKKLCDNQQHNDIVNDTVQKILKMHRPPRFSDQSITKSLLGGDPQKNLFRTLTVGDFVLDKQAVKLLKVWVNRLVNQNTLGGKFPIFVEGLPETAECQGVIAFDQFLANKEKEKRCFGFKTELTLDWLLDACNALSRKTIDHELDFYDGINGKGVDQLKQFYNNLKDQLDNIGTQETIINLGWGVGWCGITGQLIETDKLTRDIRKKLKLAHQEKYLSFPFPKSRRLAEINQEVKPMGWVRIDFTSLAEQKQQQENETQAAIEADTKKQQWEKMSEQEKRLAAIRQDPLAVEFDRGKTVDPIQSIWPFISDDQTSAEHKKELARAFKKRWQSENRWNVKKKKYKQFQKVQVVKQILGDN